DRPVGVVLGSRAGADAAGLSASGRHLARRQAMYARRGAGELLAGRRVLLVDDIVTTGATLGRAAEIVRSLGAADVRAAVVAETEKQVAGR
ncbi:ComF family protein, partial [Cumulibacter manganitolerans]|uniref:ComF family protein n=1 Tax=Cumulibacter manganitolerans TaxID=1884992 RepID=UPI00225E3CF7